MDAIEHRRPLLMKVSSILDYANGRPDWDRGLRSAMLFLLLVFAGKSLPAGVKHDAQTGSSGVKQPAHSDRRGFSCSVRAQEPIKCAGLHPEIDVIHGAGASKQPRQTLCFNCEFHRICSLAAHSESAGMLAASKLETKALCFFRLELSVPLPGIVTLSQLW
jgi:hypothetical protein